MTNLNSIKEIESVKKYLENELNGSVYVKIDEYYFEDSDKYFGRVNHIFEVIKNNPDYVGYDRGLFLLNSFEINQDIELDRLGDIINVNFDDEIAEGQSKLSDLSDEDKEYYLNKLKEHIQDDCIDYDDLETVFEDYSEYNDNILETLAYWTIYFEPETFDEEIAYKCDLQPFTYCNSETGEERDLLALGGCGMDLSPRLDAYQALTSGKIDPSSSLLKGQDKAYAEYVIGKELAKEALQKAKMSDKKISFTCYVKAKEANKEINKGGEND